MRIRSRQILVLAIVAACLSGCLPDNSRSGMNPRKEAVYKYVGSLLEEDVNASTMGGASRLHPLRLKPSPPTQAEMEAAIGKADFTGPALDNLLDEGDGAALEAYWWEKDSTWEVPGIHKKGFREIIVARYGKDGRLLSVVILWSFGCEHIGRDSTHWSWIG